MFLLQLFLDQALWGQQSPLTKILVCVWAFITGNVKRSCLSFILIKVSKAVGNLQKRKKSGLSEHL